MILLLIGRILQIALAVFQIRLATTLLQPDQYGVWILLQTVVAFFVMFLLSPIGLYLNRHILEWNSRGLLPEVFRGYSLLLLGFSVTGSIFFFVVQKIGLVNLHVSSLVYASLIMALLTFTQTFNQTWIPSLNFLGKRKEFVLGTSLATLASLIIVFVLAKTGWSSPESWAVSFSIGGTIAAFIFIPKGWYKFSPARFNEFKGSLKLAHIFQFSLPLFFSTMFIWFQTQGYRFIVEKKVGLVTFGQFAAGYAVVAGLFAALEVVIISFYQPKFYKGITEGNVISEELKHVWNLTLYPYFLAAVFLFFLAPEIAGIFLNAKFISSTDWISWVILSEGMRVLFNTVCINYHATKKTYNIAWTHFIGAILTLILFIFTSKLTYFNLLIYLGAGYLVSIVLLVLMDLKNFIDSRFFNKLLISLIICAVYFFMVYEISKFTSGNLKIVVVSILGFIFITPYYLKQVKGSA